MISWISSPWNSQEEFLIETLELDSHAKCVHASFKINLGKSLEFQQLKKTLKKHQEKKSENIKILWDFIAL